VINLVGCRSGARKWGAAKRWPTQEKIIRVGWKARVEDEIVKTENLVVEVGGGVRMRVSTRAQAALAGELLRAIGLGRGC